MTRRLFSLLLIFMLITPLITLTQGAVRVEAAPKTIHVDDDNTAGPWDGTPEHPYQNITSALERASTGDTIYVYNGTYHEHLLIDKGVSLVGEHRTATIVEADWNATCFKVMANNVGITGFTIAYGEYGVHCNSSYNTVSQNKIMSNSFGIVLSGSFNNLSGNEVIENGEGVINYDPASPSRFSSDNTITYNNITNNHGGIRLHDSSNSTVTRNNLVNNMHGVDLNYYSSNNFVSGNNITANHEEGIWLANSSDNTIFGNYISNNSLGFYISGSSNSTISGNNITANNAYGIYLYNSDCISIYENNIANNYRGMELESGSNSNTVSGNNITANNYGIHIWHSSNNNSLVGNNMANNEYGLRLESSSNNTVSDNIIANNTEGIEMIKSENNSFYHNSFRNNTIHAWGDLEDNTWDKGYPSGGNYWSDFKEKYPEVRDDYRGPYQNVSGSDGIWDHPYVLDPMMTQDNYPLMSPYQYWIDPIPGDINRDQRVDYKDLFQLARSYGSEPGDKNWNPNCDLNEDGKVDYKDLFILARNYGNGPK